jgi:glutamate dehydrogenase (NADP+)
MNLKNERRGRIKEYADQFKGTTYIDGKRPWSVPCDIAFPSATQNEVDVEDATTLVGNGCFCVSEGANMPTVPDGVEVFQKAGILYGPGKAANAGGVATSSLEMSQNALHLNWTREEVESRLRIIMKAIHDTCVEYGKEGEKIDYVKGANVGGFIKIADSMLDQGII